MGIGTGLGGSLMVSEETVYGTYATPTKGVEVNKSEIKKAKATVQGGGVFGGRSAQLASRRVLIGEDGQGSLEIEGTNKGFGLWLKHIFGVASISQIGATAAWQQTYAVGDNRGLSLSMQNGVPDTSGVVRPYTGKGGKITKMSLSCTATGLLMCSIDLDFQKVSEVETLVAPTPPASAASTYGFHGGQMRVRLGTFGSETIVAGVKGITLDIERPQATERDYAQNVSTPLLKAEPLWNNWLSVSGSLDVDFVNKVDFMDRFAADAQTAMVFEWIGNTISAPNSELLQFRLPATFFEDTSPTLQGPDVVGGSIPFTCQLDLTNGQIAASYTSTDTTIAA